MTTLTYRNSVKPGGREALKPRVPEPRLERGYGRFGCKVRKVYLSGRSMHRGYYYAKSVRGKWNRADQVVCGMRFSWYMTYGSLPQFKRHEEHASPVSSGILNTVETKKEEKPEPTVRGGGGGGASAASHQHAGKPQELMAQPASGSTEAENAANSAIGFSISGSGFQVYGFGFMVSGFAQAFGSNGTDGLAASGGMVSGSVPMPGNWAGNQDAKPGTGNQELQGLAAPPAVMNWTATAGGTTAITLQLNYGMESAADWDMQALQAAAQNVQITVPGLSGTDGALTATANNAIAYLIAVQNARAETGAGITQAGTMNAAAPFAPPDVMVDGIMTAVQPAATATEPANQNNQNESGYISSFRKKQAQLKVAQASAEPE